MPTDDDLSPHLAAHRAAISIIAPSPRNPPYAGTLAEAVDAMVEYAAMMLVRHGNTELREACRSHLDGLRRIGLPVRAREASDAGR